MTATGPDPVPASSPAASAGTGEDAHHVHQLVLSRHVSGEGILDRVAEVVNRIIGSMWVFVAISAGIVAWLFAGNVLGSSGRSSSPRYGVAAGVVGGWGRSMRVALRVSVCDPRFTVQRTLSPTRAPCSRPPSV